MRFYGKFGRVLDAVTRAYALNSIVQLGRQNFGTLILVVVNEPRDVLETRIFFTEVD